MDKHPNRDPKVPGNDLPDIKTGIFLTVPEYQKADFTRVPLRLCGDTENTSEANHSSKYTLIYSHDLEGAVGRVEELELFDGALRDCVEGGTTPAPLHQADGLCCKHITKTFIRSDLP